MTSTTSAIYFGILQGLTEFLPVSSSGHLLLLRSLLTPYDQPLLLDIILHLGSLSAILFYFRKTIKDSFKDLLKPLTISVIPAIFVGLFIYQKAQHFFTSPQYLGFAFLLTSLFLFIFPHLSQGNTKLSKITPLKALVIGLFQALAIIPGISRSGATIFAGKLNKLESKVIFQFAFLMALPAILGSLTLALKDGFPSFATTSINFAVSGLIASFLTSLLALRLLNLLFQKKNLQIFAWYTLILSAISFGLFV